MIYIGKNEDSVLLVGISKSRQLFGVSRSDASNFTVQEIQKFHTERLGEDCEIIPNFTFLATIVPFATVTTKSGKHGGMTFVDNDDPRLKYIMSQKPLLELLQCIITGEVETTQAGFYGLFTFNATARFGISVYRGKENA